jgi:hypothetical protein
MMRGATGVLEWAMILINLGTILICLKYCVMLFGKPKDELRNAPADWWKQVAVFVLGFLCLVLGVFGEAFKNFAFNLEMHVDALSYLEKAGVFGASMVAAILITKFVLRDGKILSRIRTINLGFIGMTVSVGVFFALLVVATGII